MGDLFNIVGQYIDEPCQDEIVLEIGSDRFEGSSYYFADLAHMHGMKFITVDLDLGAVERAKKNVPSEMLGNCEFVCAEALQWTESFGKGNKKIRVLYLDNFDWDWNVESHSDMIAKQKIWYGSRNLIMNNLNSQISHLGQMINLLPSMSQRCVICIDDTYQYNGVYIGKGGAVVPYLMHQGFGLLATRNNGVILGRGYKNIIV